MTFHDLQKIVQQSQSQSDAEQSELLQRLRDKPFWIWGPKAAQTRGHQNKRGLLFQSYHRLTKKRWNREINIRL